MIAQSCAANQAHLRSHSGPGSGEVFSPTGVPAATLFTSPTAHHSSSVRVRRKARPCGTPQGSCARSGRLKSRAMPTERTLARVCREAGAVVLTNVKLT